MLIHCRATTPAAEGQVAREVSALLAQRAALADPPASLVVSDVVAPGIAELFRSPTPSGQVMNRFCRTGSIDSADLVEAARFEQDYASAEGHAALYCLSSSGRGARSAPSARRSRLTSAAYRTTGGVTVPWLNLRGCSHAPARPAA